MFGNPTADDVTQAQFTNSRTYQYMGDGPGEPHDNVAANLAGHLLQPRQPGQGFEDEPTDDAEKSSQNLASNAAQAQQAMTFDHAQAMNNVRGALRGGAVGTFTNTSGTS